MLSLAVLTAALLAASSQAHPASSLAVAVVKEQFTQAKLVPDIFPTFEPIGTVQANFSTVGVITTGQVLSLNESAVQPTVSIKGSAAAEATAGGPFNDTATLYTVLIVDGFAPGNTNTSGLVRHYLANNLAYGPNNDHSVLLTNSTPAITDYRGPAPPAGSGPHRYVILIFAQPANFTAPASLSQPGTPLGRFDPNAYIAEANLGTPIAATYFVVEATLPNTISVASTTAIQSSTFAEFSAAQASATGHGGSGTGAGTGSATGSAPSAASSRPASAASATSLSLGAGILAVGVAAWSAMM